MHYEDLAQPKHRVRVSKQSRNITKLSKTAILKHLVARFLRDYQVDILCVLVAAEFTFIIVKDL